MNHLINVPISGVNCTIRQLTRSDAPDLQWLYDLCSDYAVLEQGYPYSSTAALEEFDARPEGKTEADKFVFGMVDEQGSIVGVIECIRYYPDERTYWLGLMLLAPKVRRTGLRAQFYSAFEHWVATQEIRFIQLAAQEENGRGLAFWQGLGFEEIRRTEPRQRGEKYHTLIVMRKAVEASYEGDSDIPKAKAM